MGRHKEEGYKEVTREIMRLDQPGTSNCCVYVYTTVRNTIRSGIRWRQTELQAVR
jgi:hypothetical protein